MLVARIHLKHCHYSFQSPSTYIFPRNFLFAFRQNGKHCLRCSKCKCQCKFNVKHGECLRDHPSQRLTIKCLTIIMIELEFGNVGFSGDGKTWVPGEKPLGAGKRNNDNSTNILYRVRETNPRHIGGRRGLSPLRLPCSPQSSYSSYSPWT